MFSLFIFFVHLVTRILTQNFLIKIGLIPDRLHGQKNTSMKKIKLKDAFATGAILGSDLVLFQSSSQLKKTSFNELNKSLKGRGSYLTTGITANVNEILTDGDYWINSASAGSTNLPSASTGILEVRLFINHVRQYFTAIDGRVYLRIKLSSNPEFTAWREL